MPIAIPFVGKRNKDASSSRAERKPKVIPSISLLAQVRRVDDQTLEDYSGGRFAVWSVSGCDSTNAAVINGWTLLLNSIEYPLQVLIRQHAPDLSGVRRKLIDLRPEHMRSGRINEVGNSLLDYLASMESNGGIVGRAWYVIAKEEKAMEVASLLAQSGFGAKRLEDAELGLLLQACVSGMGYGHSQDFYQVQESGSFLELNHRYMSVYEVAKWSRRIPLLFLEQLLRTGDEMDISMWLWPASQRESHSRLQMQRSRFEGSRIVSMQKGKLVPQEVEIAIADVTRISEAVERGTSKLFRRSMTVAVYGRTQDDLKAAAERLTSHFRASLAKINPLKFRQGRGFTALMPHLRPGVGEANLTDTETLRRMFPFGPQDMNEHDGTLLGMDLRSRTPIIHNPFNPKAMNGHMVVMARSGAGKSFFTKLRVVRESQMGIPTYLIDPEGEYGVITRALGGVVFVPGSPGHGLNPFMIAYTGDEADLTNRISSLCSLVGVMLEGEVNTHRKAIIDRCLSGFYASELRNLEGNGGVLARGGIRDFYHYMESDEAELFGGLELAHLLSPFATGTARFLMEDSAHNLLVYSQLAMIQKITMTGIDLIKQCNDLQRSKGWALTSMLARSINLARMSCLALATGSFSDTFSSYRMLLDRLITLKYLEANDQYEEFEKFSYADLYQRINSRLNDGELRESYTSSEIKQYREMMALIRTKFFQDSHPRKPQHYWKPPYTNDLVASALANDGGLQQKRNVTGL